MKPQGRLSKRRSVTTLGRRRAFLIGFAAALVAAGGSVGQPAQARTIENNTPRAIHDAQDHGPAAASATMSITLWLQAPGSDAAAEQRVRELYDRSSANFHRWLSASEANGLVAPSAAQVAAVQKFLNDRHLRVVATDDHGHFVRAQVRVSDVQNALHVAIHDFTRGGRSFRANTADPVVDGAAGSVVTAISGLYEHHLSPHIVRAADPDTGRPLAAVPLAAHPDGAFYSPQCFLPPERDSFTTNGGLPTARYQGNRYGQDINNSVEGTWAPCGYQPSELQTAYGLTGLYGSGLDGTGQTIVIVDAIGSPTIAQDAELFSQIYGLPDVTPANFQVYFPGGQPPAPDTGWASETTLDVEWAHSVAPNAKIALVIAPSPSDDDLQAAVLFAIQHHLGKVISNSYGEAEADAPPALLDSWNRLNRLAAARGISIHFSTGDDGDSNPSGFTPGLILPGVSTPADSPWATAIGGTSVALDANNNIKWQTSWGTNLTRIVDRASLGSPPVVPPLQLGFQFGSGGGSSGYFDKPGFQHGLPGTQRLLPDISYVGDPYTGVEIICDATSCSGAPAGSGPEVEVIGGTSLSCPMFSGLWAIANQAAGEDGLGQAARLLYGLKRGAITDVVAVGSEHNVTGVIKTDTGVTHESAQSLAQPLDTTQPFYSALYNSPFSTRWFVLTFGTDTSLTATRGWDNSTGLGTPNGKAFVDAVVSAAHREDD
jgi:subtilase family serine protease